MRAAIEATTDDADVRVALHGYIDMAAEAMRNREHSG